MNKDVIISIKGLQKFERNNSAVELITEGTYRKTHGGYDISYNETQMTGLEGTTTRLSVDGRRVTLERSGSTNSLFVFEPGQKHLCHYDTGVGVMNVGVNTREITSSLGDAGGDLEIRFSIDINNNYSGNNIFKISLREAGSANDQYGAKS